MARRKGSPDIRPKITGAWLRAMAINDEQGKNLSILIAEAMERDVLAALNAISKFLPKQHEHDLELGEQTLVGILSALGSQRHHPEVEEQSDSVRH